MLHRHAAKVKFDMLYTDPVSVLATDITVTRTDSAISKATRI